MRTVKTRLEAFFAPPFLTFTRSWQRVSGPGLAGRTSIASIAIGAVGALGLAGAACPAAMPGRIATRRRRPRRNGRAMSFVCKRHLVDVGGWRDLSARGW